MAASSSMTSISSSRREAPSSSSSSSAHHDIFLSHSGVQKAFVKDLYRMLNPPYTPFFDIVHHSLPPSESFPKRIFEATKACKVAVIILSDEFLLSKWPMIELCAFVKVAPSVKILPVFYKLTPENLKDPSNVKKWLKAWKAHAKKDPRKRIVVSDWAQALTHLMSLNGPVFRPSDQGEEAYLEEIVSSIYEIFPKALQYEDSGIHGKDRLCEIILAKFRELDSTTLQPCILGMYGLPGTGKSTLSRCLCDHFFPCFHGWSFYLELPTNPTPDQLLNRSKELLRNLPGCHNMVNLTSIASDIHQVYHLFKTSRLPGSKVFLVVDNISSQESVDFVQHLLRLGFGAGSKVLLVARTLDVLHPLLQIHRHYVCGSLSIPSIDETEAIQILLQSGGGWNLVEAGEEDGFSPRDRQILGKIVSMSGFGGVHDHRRNYLIPLVLKIMGNQLRQYEFDIEKWGRKIENFWKKVEVCKEDAVRQLVQQSFESLPKKLQLLFLDIALFVLPSSHADGMNADLSMKKACGLLSIMHESSPERIEMEIYGLRQCCFVEIRERISLRVHDVYLEFAASIPQSCMYYLQSYGRVESPTSMEFCSSLDQAKASELRAIILDHLDEVQERLEFLASLSNVKAVVLRNCTSLAKLVLAGLTSLVSLEIHNCPKLQWVDVGNGQCLQRLKRLIIWANKQDETKEMAPLQLVGSWSSILIPAQQFMSQLLPRMNTLLSLLKQYPGIGSFASQCRWLQSLTLENTGIKRLQNMSMWWPHLGELQVVEQHLEHLELGSLLKLKRFLFSDFLLDSGRGGIGFREGTNRALGGSKDLFVGCPNLEVVRICSKSFVEANMGSLIDASKLHTLWIRNFYNFSNLGTAFPQSVEQLVMTNGDVRNVNFTWRFGSLRRLQLFHCEGLVEVSGLDHLPSLNELEIQRCTKLQTLSGLSGLVSLESLRVGHKCPNLSFPLSEVENLARLRTLKLSSGYSVHSVGIFNVANLVGLVDIKISSVDLDVTFLGLEKLGKLQEFSLWGRSKDENFGNGRSLDLSVLLLGVPKPCHLICGLKSIQTLKLCGLQNLASLNGMEFLVTLQSLSLSDLKQLTSLQGMECLVNLEDLSLSHLKQLTSLQGMEGLVNLRSLWLEGCVLVNELPSLRALVNMIWLYIRDCVKLKAVEGCDAMTRLIEADFGGCRSLESLPLDFESLRQMRKRSCSHYDTHCLRIDGCKFASVDAMVAWAEDKNVPVLLRRASLRALAWEFHTNLLEKPRERRALGVVLLARVSAYFLEQIFESNKEHYCSAFAEWANLLEERWNEWAQAYCRRVHVKVRREVINEAMTQLRRLARVSKRQVLQQCRSDASFQLSVVECLAQLDEHYMMTTDNKCFRILDIIADYYIHKLLN